ncbi:hypothetical protein V493_06557 [Pseudogymnoascus sp. VKM F-4281 (FW-2241)]|nr:hypothetical protein V493_06557 [Pseudogymnoascus sp. VKM F-4281 (FW-2241)]
MAMRRFRCVFVLFTSFLLPEIVRAACYNPDGSEVTHPAFQPCNQVVGQFGMCCGTNWTGGVVMPDKCQENGLCLNSFENAPLYWRGSCTDPTWKSPNCLANLCASDGDAGVDGSAAEQNVAVTECSDGSWCCGGSNKDCCDDGTGVKIAATLGKAISSSQSSSSISTSLPSSTASTTLSESDISTTPSTSQQTTTLPISSPTLGPAGLPTSSSEPTTGGLSSGTKVGVGVGVAGFLLAIGILVTCLVCLRRRRRVDKDTDGLASNAPRSRASVFPWARHEMPSSPNERPLPPTWHEVDGMKSPTELGGISRPVELPAERWNHWGNEKHNTDTYNDSLQPKHDANSTPLNPTGLEVSNRKAPACAPHIDNRTDDRGIGWVLLEGKRRDGHSRRDHSQVHEDPSKCKTNPALLKVERGRREIDPRVEEVAKNKSEQDADDSGPAHRSVLDCREESYNAGPTPIGWSTARSIFITCGDLLPTDGSVTCQDPTVQATIGYVQGGFNTIIDFSLAYVSAFEPWQILFRSSTHYNTSLFTRIRELNRTTKSRRLWQTATLSGPLVLSGVARIVKTHLSKALGDRLDVTYNILLFVL